MLVNTILFTVMHFLNFSFLVAGEKGFEPLTNSFGNYYSTN